MDSSKPKLIESEYINSTKSKMSTETDLRYDLLADNSKLRILPKVNEKNTSDSRSSRSSKHNSESSDIDIHIDSHKDDDEDDDIMLNSEEDDINNNFTNLNFNVENNQKNTNNVPMEENPIPNVNPINNNNSSPLPKPNIRNIHLNEDEIPYEDLDSKTQRIKRLEVFTRLKHIENYLKTNNQSLSRQYTLNSDYEEMRAEVKYWTELKKTRDAVKMGKGFLMNAVTAVEFLNDRYDPFGFVLDGWSDQVKYDADNYDSVIEDIYEKYKGSGKKMDPVVKLILMLSSSAVMFHTSKQLSKTPGLDQIIGSNPEMLQKLQGSINKKRIEKLFN